MESLKHNFTKKQKQQQYFCLQTCERYNYKCLLMQTAFYDNVICLFNFLSSPNSIFGHATARIIWDGRVTYFKRAHGGDNASYIFKKVQKRLLLISFRLTAWGMFMQAIQLCHYFTDLPWILVSVKNSISSLYLPRAVWLLLLSSKELYEIVQI